MGRFFIGRYGEEPKAESLPITLRECNQRLGLRPSDFVSEEKPDFFDKSFGALGRYVVYELTVADAGGNAVWKPGYYLLPRDAADILESLQKIHPTKLSNAARSIVLDLKEGKEVPPEIVDASKRWAEKSQSLMMQCSCTQLTLSIKAPWALRKRWEVKLQCPEKCQPPLRGEI